MVVRLMQYRVWQLYAYHDLRVAKVNVCSYLFVARRRKVDAAAVEK